MAIKKANLTKAINSSIGGSVINNGSMDVDGETYIFGDIDSTGSLKVVGTMYSAGEDSKINITSLNGDGKGVQRNAKENTANAQTASALYAAAAFNRVEINDIRKRIGDVRLTNAPDGIWARMESGQMEGRGAKNGFHKYQVGSDHKLSDKWRIGSAFSYTTGNTTYERGTNKTDTFSLAAYGVYTGKNGEYADIIGRLGVDNIDMDFYPSSAWVHQHGKLTTASFALSGEIGKTYMMKNHSF